MGMDFNVNVDVKTTGKEQIDALEKQLNELKSETVKINVEIDNKNLNGKNFNTKNFSKQLQDSVNKSVKSVKFKSSGDFYRQYIDQEKKAVKEMKSVNKNFEKELGEINTNDIDKNAQKAVRAKIAAENKAMREQQKEQKRLENIRLKEAEDSAKIIEKARNKISTGGFDAKSSVMKNKLDAYNGQDNDLVNLARKEVDSYNATLNKLKDNFDSGNSFKLNDEEIVSSYNNAISAVERFDNIMTQVRNTQSKTLDAGVAERSANTVKKYYEDNSKAIKKYGVELKDLENRYRQATTVAEKADIDNKFKNLKSSISAEGLTGKSATQELSRGFKQIGQFAVTYGAIQRIPEVLKSMATEVLNVDTAMTNLYKVTDETSAKYNEFLNNAGETSKSIGRDMSSYITQASEWAKLGYTMDQSANLSKVSSIYSNVGEVDDKTAVSDLVTVMKAYDIKYDQAISIVDKYNKLGNEFATSAQDLGEGMSNAASMLSLGGTDLNKALALLTGGSEITQSAGELGNALKIGQMRIQGMKGDLEALGEESDGLESVSKIQTHILNLTKGQVNIMDSADSTKFRDYYDILKDVSEVWDELEQTERADLLETMFGKNRGNQGAAVIQAFQSGQVQKAYEATLNAEGSAQQEQDRWMQSMEAKIQQFRSQFQELSNTALNSDFLKGAIDSGTGLLNILTQIIDVGGGIPTLLTAIGGVKLFKNLDLFY